MKPKYKHSCKDCIFLGRYENDDLYFCQQMGQPTVIARHSDNPSDYTSGLKFADAHYNPLCQKTMPGHPGLAKAKELAQERGLLGAEI